MCQQDKQDTPDGNQTGTFFEHILKLIPVPGTVVVADNRCTADRISKEDRYEYEVYIHDRAVGSHTIFACVFHKLQVVERVHERGREVRHKLRRTVCTCLQQDHSVKFCLSKFQQAGILPCKIEDREESTDAFSGYRRNRGARQSPSQDCDKQII